jgi:hypothetical protein
MHPTEWQGKMRPSRNIASGMERPDHARHALERAQQLSDARPEPDDMAAWFHESLHVGDLSALAIASVAE